MTMRKMLMRGLVLSFVVIAAGSAQAESEWQGFAGQAFVGRTNDMGPNCPPMQFHVVPDGKDGLLGIAYTASGPQMSVYTVGGNLNANGQVTLDLKPVASGPSVKVEGTFKNGMLMAKMGGGTCHEAGFMLMPVAQPIEPVQR